VSGEDFGNFQLVTISGTVFNDLNDDHVQDNGEPGIPNVVVNLSNGQSAATDANGNYSITGVGPGTFTVSERVPSGYMETYPTGNAFSLTTSSGNNVSRQDFADAKPVVAQDAVFGFSGYYETGNGWYWIGQGWDDGKSRTHDASSTAATANWILTKRGGLPTAKYEIFLTYAAGPNRATNAGYKIFDGSTLLTTETVDQTQAPFGGTYQSFAWTSLGVFTIERGRISISLSDNAAGSVDADGVLILYAGSGQASARSVSMNPATDVSMQNPQEVLATPLPPLAVSAAIPTTELPGQLAPVQYASKALPNSSIGQIGVPAADPRTHTVRLGATHKIIDLIFAELVPWGSLDLEQGRIPDVP
jgi:hypothetical protein